MTLNKKLTICIPTKNRPDFLSRLLNYYASTNFDGWLFIGDSSESTSLSKNHNLINKLKNQLNIRYFEFPKLSAEKVLEELSKSISTEFVVLSCDDDFLCSPSLGRCVKFLEKNQDYSAAHGKGFTLDIHSHGSFGEIANFCITPLPKIDAESGCERLEQFIFHQLHNVNMLVTRRDIWVNAFQDLNKLSNLHSSFIFGELISASIVVIMGKIAEIDSLYLVRQGHPKSHYVNIYKNKFFEWFTDENWYTAHKLLYDRVLYELVKQDKISSEKAKEKFRKIFFHFYANTIANGYRGYLKRFGDSKQYDLSSRLLSIMTRIGYKDKLKKKLKKIYYRLSRLFASKDNDKLSELANLLRESSPYHKDFMPIYEAVTKRPADARI